MTKRETPKFTGIIIHRDRLGRFSVRHPTDWRSFELRDGVPNRDGASSELVLEREGIGFTPNPGDPHTALTVWVAPLEGGVVAEDLDELRAGVNAGLQALDDCHVETASDVVLGNLIKFERVYTFRERPAAGDANQFQVQSSPFNDGTSPGDTLNLEPGPLSPLPGAVRKRKQWLLYVDRWLICLTWQGSGPEEYQYWLAMANYSFLTFEIPEALWFATDRDLAATRSSPATERLETTEIGD